MKHEQGNELPQQVIWDQSFYELGLEVILAFISVFLLVQAILYTS